MPLRGLVDRKKKYECVPWVNKTMILLNLREKKLAMIGATVIAVWALYSLAISPTLARIETLDRVIPEKRAAMATLEVKSRQYHTMRNRLEHIHRQIAQQTGNFALVAFLEKSARKCGLTNNVTVMQEEPGRINESYCETLVTVELEALPVGQLVQFLTTIREAPAFVRIKNLSLGKAAGNDNLLNATVGVSTLEVGN